MPLRLLILLVNFMTVATAISLDANFSGGVFSSSPFIGDVGRRLRNRRDTGNSQILHRLWRLSTGWHGAVAGSLLGAPISTILIVLELTGDYAVTIES